MALDGCKAHLAPPAEGQQQRDDVGGGRLQQPADGEDARRAEHRERQSHVGPAVEQRDGHELAAVQRRQRKQVERVDAGRHQRDGAPLRIRGQRRRQHRQARGQPRHGTGEQHHHVLPRGRRTRSAARCHGPHHRHEEHMQVGPAECAHRDGVTHLVHEHDGDQLGRRVPVEQGAPQQPRDGQRGHEQHDLDAALGAHVGLQALLGLQHHRQERARCAATRGRRIQRALQQAPVAHQVGRRTPGARERGLHEVPAPDPASRGQGLRPVTLDRGFDAVGRDLGCQRLCLRGALTMEIPLRLDRVGARVHAVQRIAAERERPAGAVDGRDGRAVRGEGHERDREADRHRAAQLQAREMGQLAVGEEERADGFPAKPVEAVATTLEAPGLELADRRKLACLQWRVGNPGDAVHWRQPRAAQHQEDADPRHDEDERHHDGGGQHPGIPRSQARLPLLF